MILIIGDNSKLFIISQRVKLSSKNIIKIYDKEFRDVIQGIAVKSKEELLDETQNPSLVDMIIEMRERVIRKKSKIDNEKITILILLILLLIINNVSFVFNN